MFNKILIANRGEIACRVIATARRMGIRTVAVYSDADRDSLHVQMADEAVHIGASPATASYLVGERIIQAAVDTKAEAIHPGYGFLSENPDFVVSVEAAGLTFIGPGAEAIRAMGLKDAAKARMQAAGVPIVPGFHGTAQDAQTLATEAEGIGYPVLIKARAGGGGKGMRLVNTPDEFKTSLEAAQREGQASFGDPACLIEKYITRPRHIEIQILGDTHGNVVHLFERDCSLQRRHQKVIEEAPAPGMPVEVREAMGQAAVNAAKAIGYCGAGTVEFIVDASDGLRPDGFWFMEMNTRLQVEHPVTEAITGLDLVELQLRVAAGEPLPVTQGDLAIDGWAFEARLYAEDVPAGFLPATGTLEHLVFPDARRFERGPLRIDSGIAPGDVISPFYDPMIAKIIVHGATRDAALTQLNAALRNTEISGSTTNIDFLCALSSNEAFKRGDVSTDLIEDHLDSLAAPREIDQLTLGLAAVVAAGMTPPNTTGGGAALANFRQWGNATREVAIECGDAARHPRVTRRDPHQFDIEVDDTRFTLHVENRGQGVLLAGIDGDNRRRVSCTRKRDIIYLHGEHGTFEFTPIDPMQHAQDEHGGGDVIIAPMPGLVTSVSVSAGESVTSGQTVLVLEAMKMEHALTAPRDGIVADVIAATGAQVEAQSPLLTLVPEND